jgi:hypothetical protein
MDDNEARVNGSWVTRIANSDEWGITIKTIFGPVIESSVTYSIPVTYAGMYNVLVWNNPNGTYSKNVPVSINGIVTILNEAVGVLGWQNIGQYNLTKGTTTISILGTGTGLIVADAVKIESVDRYNDGSLVSSVVLQPNDAIILLTTNSGTITPTATPTQTFIPNKPSKPTFLPTSTLTR